MYGIHTYRRALIKWKVSKDEQQKWSKKFANWITPIGLNFKLTSLEDRRISRGLIQVFKIVRSFEEVQLVGGLNFALNRQRSRGNSFQLKRDLVKNCTSSYHFLLNRLVGAWNKLPEKVVSSSSVNQFKQKYDNLC